MALRFARLVGRAAEPVEVAFDFPVEIMRDIAMAIGLAGVPAKPGNIIAPGCAPEFGNGAGQEEKHAKHQSQNERGKQRAAV